MVQLFEILYLSLEKPLISGLEPTLRHSLDSSLQSCLQMNCLKHLTEGPFTERWSYKLVFVGDATLHFMDEV